MCQPKKSSLWIMQFEIFSVKLSLICIHWTQPLPPSWFNLIKMQISHVVYQECKHWNKFLLQFNYEQLSLLYKYHVCMTYVTSAVNRHFNVTSHCLFVIDIPMGTYPTAHQTHLGDLFVSVISHGNGKSTSSMIVPIYTHIHIYTQI